jgi:DNA repair protein RadC
MVEIQFYKLKLVKENLAQYNAVSKQLNTPKKVVDLINALELNTEPEEVLSLITVDVKNNVTGIFEVSRGHLSASIVHPREVFKRAILNNASGIFLVHNHPSGDVTPSKADIEVTKTIKKSGELLQIKLIDHIIVGDGCYSFLENGYI